MHSQPVLKVTCINQSPALKATISDPIKGKEEEMYSIKPASMAQLDARPTGDLEVAGSTPPDRQNSFVERTWNIFYGHSLPSVDSRSAVVSFWRKTVHNIG